MARLISHLLNSIGHKLTDSVVAIIITTMLGSMHWVTKMLSDFGVRNHLWLQFKKRKEGEKELKLWGLLKIFIWDPLNHLHDGLHILFQLFNTDYNSESFIFPLCTDSKRTLELPNVTVRSMFCSFGFCVYPCVQKTNETILKTKPISYESIAILANSVFRLKASDEL